MKIKLKAHKGALIVIGIVLLLVCGWLLLWNHVGKQVEKAAYEASYDTLVFDGAYYQKCDLPTVQDYLPDVQAVDASLCGEQVGDLSFPSEAGNVTCPLFSCKPLDDAGKEKALLLLKRETEYAPYELTGFQYLDESPSIWAVCASYGIGAATDFESVTVYDAEDHLLETLTEKHDLLEFFDLFVKLGDPLPDDEQSQRYYDAYMQKFGESDKVFLKDGKVQTSDDAAYEEAMQFWTEGLRKVDLRLKNGLQIRGCIYAPVPGIFSVYGDYAITEPFFED